MVIIVMRRSARTLLSRYMNPVAKEPVDEHETQAAPGQPSYTARESHHINYSLSRKTNECIILLQSIFFRCFYWCGDTRQVSSSESGMLP